MLKKKPTSSVMNDDLKIMPMSIVKNICATACMICYDMLMQQPSMTKTNQHIFLYNSFHGNEDKNMSSQIGLLMEGRGVYCNLYVEIPNTTQITDKNHQSPPNKIASGAKPSLMLHSRFCHDGCQYIVGKHFNIQTLSSPAKTKLDEKITGRNIYDLAIITLRNLKKATAFAEEWLNGGDLPSGNTWDDLYSHLITDRGPEFGKDLVYTGYYAFAILTKYNDENGSSCLSVFNTDGGGKRNSEDGGNSSRKKKKAEKDDERSVAIGNTDAKPGFIARGMKIGTRIDLISMAQTEDAKKVETDKMSLAYHTNVNELLLQERKQAFDIAKTVCPKYDATNPFWIEVTDLTTQIANAKRELSKVMHEHEMNKKQGTKATTLANSLLEKVGNDDLTVIKDIIPMPDSTTNTTPASISTISSSVSGIPNTTYYVAENDKVNSISKEDMDNADTVEMENSDIGEDSVECIYNKGKGNDSINNKVSE